MRQGRTAFAAAAHNVSIDDDSGMTANVGVEAADSISDHLMVRGDARYRYIAALVVDYDRSVVRWRF